MKLAKKMSIVRIKQEEQGLVVSQLLVVNF